MTAMPRAGSGCRASVAFTTNYPMDAARERWAQGSYPRQHLWGALGLEAAGYDVHYIGVPHRGARLGRVGDRARFLLGPARPQLAAARLRADVAYAADPSSFATLALLRSVGMWRRPVVAVVHPDAPTSLTMSRTLRSYDVVVVFSRLLHTTLVSELGRPASRTLLATYGPDLKWAEYDAPTEDTSVVVCSGKTRRDHATLLAALGRTGLSGRVHTQQHADVRTIGHVQVVGNAGYPEVLDDLRRAAVVAVPLADTSGTFGITEVNDALALAKPVVITRNPHLDVDVEAVGCGITVEAGDVDGWSRALRELAADPDRRAEMGARGRTYAETSWNAERFEDAICSAVGMALA
jgi:glycosyltransferase involved in cell wall biosynthesis